VDHQEHIKKQLSTRTLRSASSAQGPYAEPVLRVCAGAQGGALTPRRTLELAWTVPKAGLHPRPLPCSL
jgi:hypothetical protein